MRALANRARENSFIDVKKGGYALVLMLSLCTYIALIATRGLDDNTLTSWRWVFAQVDAGMVLLAITAATVAAYRLSAISIPERYLPAVLFLVSFAAAMPFWRAPELIVDSSRYFTQAKHLAVYGIGYFLAEWGREIAVWTDLPLVPLIYGLIFEILGESRIFIQAAATLFFAGTVVITYHIGKTLWDKNTGFYGGLLLLGIPYIYTQVPMMLVDVPTMFFFALATYSYIQLLERGGAGNMLFSAASIMLALLSKYSTWLMMSILMVVFLVYLVRAKEGGFAWDQIRANQKALTYRSSTVLLLCAVAATAIAIAESEVILAQLGLLTSYQQPGLRRWGENFLSTFFFQTHPFLTFAAIYSVGVAFRRKDIKYMVVSWPVLIILALQIERIRYIIMALPMFALMASYGLQQVRDTNLRKYIAYCAVFSSLAIANFAYLPFVQSISAVNLQDAGRYLNRSGIERIEVFTIPPRDDKDINLAVAVPTLDLFVAPEILYRHSRPLPPAKSIKESPMRFTWDYRNPRYYEAGGSDQAQETAVVVIAESRDEPLPEDITRRLTGYRIARVFDSSTGHFRYQTVVTVYRTAAAAKKDGR